MYRLIKSFTMACAHYVPGAGKCERVHGHNYRVKFCVEGNILNQQQMLIDFRRVKEHVRNRYDHRLLNEVSEFSEKGDHPSTERMTETLYQQIQQLCNEEAFPPHLRWVEVQETEEASVRYEPGRFAEISAELAPPSGDIPSSDTPSSAADEPVSSNSMLAIAASRAIVRWTGPSDAAGKGVPLRSLGSKISYPESYDPRLLETIPNGNQDIDYVVKLYTPEFTTLCPQTGQPDYASLTIRYVPGLHLVESKSLKLYLVSFRNHGNFHENCVVEILQDLRTLLSPKYIEVRGKFRPRGGISIDPYVNFGQPGTRWEEVARQQQLQDAREEARAGVSFT